VLVVCVVTIVAIMKLSSSSIHNYSQPEASSQTTVQEHLSDFLEGKGNPKDKGAVLDAAPPDIPEYQSSSDKVEVEVSPMGVVDPITQDKGETQIPSLSTLNCEKYGGPPDASEMVYWHDIPSDHRYVSPFKDPNKKRYMTFEPDGGGWNNIRMAMETVLGLGTLRFCVGSFADICLLAIATGRTLVLPPEQRMYLLAKDRGKIKTDFSFADFFPMHELAAENDGLELITMQEFLETVAMTGQLRNKVTNEITFPPENRTDWNGEDVKVLKEWLRNSTHTPLWSPSKCMAAFPSSGDAADAQHLHDMVKTAPRASSDPFQDNPLPVDADPKERLVDNIAGRKELCIYDPEMQQELVLHFMCYHKMRVRMLVHFYAFLYFESWREDLWMKRFMRDHVRYTDEIQCAAARIVKALREESTEDGAFDSFHIRRGDFQFKRTRIEAEEIYQNTKEYLQEGSLVFVATDERNKAFFDDMKKHYKLKFLDDFKDILEGVNVNHYGMIGKFSSCFNGCSHLYVLRPTGRFTRAKVFWLLALDVSL